jgi:ATP-dependent DNA helicase RecQ
MTTPLAAALRENFGFSELRPGQADAIEPVLAGRDALVVMPTGAGKSLVYQLAACLSDGLTLVISPLIALMKDQVDALVGRGIAAAALHSGQTAEEQRAVYEAVRKGDLRLLYVAPERLQNPAFAAAMRSARITLLAVDEAHCVSQWGHDFRPDYLSIAPARARLGSPPTVALTATATPRVQHDIAETLALTHPARVITGFNRPNLTFEVRHAPTAATKRSILKALLTQESGAALVYVSTRKQAESVARFVADELGRPAEAYHAGLPDRQRVDVQDAFISRSLDLVVATNAFGMGVDRADVRLVVHWALPGNLESYYQEAGRAGRDGAASRAVLLYASRDASLRRWLIEQGAPETDRLAAVHADLARLAQDRVATVEVDALANNLGDHPVAVRVALAMLGRAGAVERLDDAATAQRYVVRDLSPARLARVVAVAEEHQRAKDDALDGMIRYAEEDICRRRAILEHFGDPAAPLAPRCCDVCDAAAAAQAPPPDELPAYDALPRASRVALGLLDAVRRLPYPVGRGTLVRILAGSTASGMDRPAYTRSPYFGRLKEMRQQDIDAAFRHLIAEGYLKVAGGERPVVKLTSAGQRALAHREELEMPLPEPGARPAASGAAAVESLEGEARERFEALRAWRLETAQREGLPSYMVFSNRTLAALAQARPTTGDALLAIPGIGPAKHERYGTAVLAILEQTG